MPRAQVSRATSSRPYDRRSSTASPARCPPASPIQTVDQDPNQDQDIIPPDVPGLPTYAEYKRIETAYLHSLSPRKRDKALITQATFDKIWDVLHQPEACTIDTPQFRFWVRKMFSLSRPGGTQSVGSDADTSADLALERSLGIGRDRSTADGDALAHTSVVLHEHRPVAIMEQLYALFCYCHVRAGHGGRDKTCAVIREHYSWVPKELTAQFVKACPTCVLKRNGHGHGAVDVGVLAYTARRVVGRARKKGDEMSVPTGPAGVGWPTTGGPLDPEPCGVRERPVGASPARKGSLLDGWNNIPRHHEEPRTSPAKPALPSLASALSNESLDANLELTSPADDTACLLPPALRPHRLRGPVPSDVGDAEAFTSASASEFASASASYPFQIDPLLLAFNYPGLDTSEPDVRPYVRLRGPGAESPGALMWNMPVPALVPSRASDSPDSSFEHASLPLSLSTEFMAARSRCGSHESPFAYNPGQEIDA